MSAELTSIRHRSPWCRARYWWNPSDLRTSSACSTDATASRDTRVPVGNREARHANDALSAVGRPRQRLSRRISSLDSPASWSGAATARSRAARWPTRVGSRASSAMAP